MTIRGKSTLAIRICRQCGIEFMGGPRAWYCPGCRAERARAADKRYKAKGKAERPLGSIDKCVICGKEFIVQAARQKYCENCAPAAIRRVDREQGKGWLKKAIERHGEEYYQKYLERKRTWGHQQVKAAVCPMCGQTAKHGYTYCCDKCKDAGTRYGYAKYKFKIGKLKTEPKLADYQKGGRLYERH